MNAWQREVRAEMESTETQQASMAPLLTQHARLHSGEISSKPIRSYQDQVLAGLEDPQWRTIPAGGEHSIAWCLWHTTRTEDAAMNILVANQSQVLLDGNWHRKMDIFIVHTGNKMTMEEIALLNKKVDISALLAYRNAVGTRTRRIMRAIDPRDLNKKIKPDRIESLFTCGAVTEATRGLADYWSRRTIAGLLLMPASRHILVHLNEIKKLRAKIS